MNGVVDDDDLNVPRQASRSREKLLGGCLRELLPDLFSLGVGCARSGRKQVAEQDCAGARDWRAEQLSVLDQPERERARDIYKICCVAGALERARTPGSRQSPPRPPGGR